MRTYNLLSFFLCFLLSGISLAQEDKPEALPTVFKLEIRDEIDPRMTRYVELALQEAKSVQPDYIVVEMDTYGGLVTDADEISSMFLREETPLYVFINVDAASAGALISIACDSIYMVPGASIGAATVVVQTGEAAPDKYQSYMRKKMRSTAEASGRDPDIAEGMVDQDIEIEGVTTEGKVITFSTKEALANGYCEGQVRNIDELMARSGVTGYELISFELPASEKVVAFFLNPFISGILILIVIGGIYFELQTPGVGFPIGASVVALILYLTPYYLTGLAESWEIVVFMIGVALLMIEIFVTPGFGVPGVSGIVCMVGSLILMMLNNDYFDFSLIPMAEIITATVTTLAAFLGAIILIFVMGASLANSVLFRRVALVTTQDRSEGYTANFEKISLMGKLGSAYTILRPSGKIMVKGALKDAYTRGEYIEKGEAVVIISEEGTSLRVRKATEEEVQQLETDETEA